MCSRRAHFARVPSLDPVQTLKALIHQPTAATAQFNPRSHGAAARWTVMAPLEALSFRASFEGGTIGVFTLVSLKTESKSLLL